MNNKQLIKLSKQYFNAFSNQSLSLLENIYAENIELIDWDQKIYGKQEVIAANLAFFNSIKKIKVSVTKIHAFENSVACEISININQQFDIKVLDLITWSDEGQILKIDAYRQ